MTTAPRSAFLAAVASAALALAACGAASDDEAGDREDAAEGALAFARCMREHGVDMPDPEVGADGGIKITARRSARAGGKGPEKGTIGPGGGDAKEQAAFKACGKHLEGGGEAPSAAQRAKMQDSLVAYARCMRAEGIDMPDPKVESGGGGLRFQMGGPGKLGPDSPRFKAADAKCHDHLGDVGKMRSDASR